jgi:hypothetical protein
MKYFLLLKIMFRVSSDAELIREKFHTLRIEWPSF